MSSWTYYNYDEQVRLCAHADNNIANHAQGQFFPYFILTVTTLVTVPATISFFRPSKGARSRRAPTSRLPSNTYTELENTGTTIESNFTPEHADLIQGQRKKQKRAERRTKRGILMLGGWSLNALMVYLIYVTAQTVTKIWDPYDVLGISRVRVLHLMVESSADSTNRTRTRRRSRSITESCRSACTPTKPAKTHRRTLQSSQSTTTG